MEGEFTNMPVLGVLSHLKERFTEEEVTTFLMHIWRVSYGAFVRLCNPDGRTNTSDGSADGESTCLHKSHEFPIASNMFEDLHPNQSGSYGSNSLTTWNPEDFIGY
jgi:hypothetical protein